MSQATSPDVPDKGWDNPFGSGTWMHDLFDSRVRQNRDLTIILDDYYGGRGTGKTVSSIQLAAGMDQTDEGLTWEKCSLRPEEIRNAYASQPKRSGLVFDEGEVGASNREAMTNTNKALREIVSMGRVEQKYVVINAPLRGFIDSDLLKLADVWISMVRRGRGLVHHLRWEPYSEQLLVPKKQWIDFADVPVGSKERDIYNRLTSEKRDLMDGDEATEFIPKDEHREELQQAKSEARQEKRDEVIRNIMSHPEIREASRHERIINDRVVGEAVGLDRSRVSRIRREGGADAE